MKEVGKESRIKKKMKSGKYVKERKEVMNRGGERVDDSMHLNSTFST